MIRINLPQFNRFDAWRSAARKLASNRIAPENICWSDADSPPELFGEEEVTSMGPHSVVANKEFLSTLKLAAHHSDQERWSLLYQALYRHQNDKQFINNPREKITLKLTSLTKSVSRDIHKMHAFVRFHELTSDTDRRNFVSWFEPEHPILEIGTPFFAKRFADMNWLIATPYGVARFDGTLKLEPLGEKPDLPKDAQHELWATYFANIFNPARVKIKAMQSEMPKKYWKNLPETRLIPEMIADAERRVEQMALAGASTAPKRAAKVTARLRSQNTS